MAKTIEKESRIVLLEHNFKTCGNFIDLFFEFIKEGDHWFDYFLFIREEHSKVWGERINFI